MKHKFLILSGLLLVILGLITAVFRSRTLETAAWGLHFETEGQPPKAPASADELKKYDAAYLGDPSEKTIYLTFDAGYENGTTGKILDVLREKQVPAAFFLAGNYLERNPDLVRRMAEEGHIVGNHTMHHRDMSKITAPDAFSWELNSLSQLYQSITGSPMPKFYRPPMGIYSAENLAQAKKMGYKTILWSLAYADWDNEHQPTREEAFSRLIPRIHPGAIVLLHCTSRTNGEILAELLDRWTAMGYTFKSISEIFP